MSTPYEGEFGDDRAVREILDGHGEHPDGDIDDQLSALMTGRAAEAIPDYDESGIEAEE
jgi:hypothetical protein